MQIRIQARKIQCIRSVYDPEIKRSRQKVAASFPSWCRSLADAPADALAALDDEERQQLETWLNERRERDEASYRRSTARMADKFLNYLATAITSNEVELSADYAARIWKAMGGVDKALRKVGHPRIKRARAKPGSAPKETGMAE